MARALFIHKYMAPGHARTLHPTAHSAPCGAISAQEQRQQQQSQEPTALQLHGSLSHEKQHELTQVPSLNEVSCSSWKIKFRPGRYSMTSKQNLIPQGWNRKSPLLLGLLGPRFETFLNPSQTCWVSIATKLRSQPRSS